VGASVGGVSSTARKKNPEGGKALSVKIEKKKHLGGGNRGREKTVEEEERWKKKPSVVSTGTLELYSQRKGDRELFVVRVERSQQKSQGGGEPKRVGAVRRIKGADHVDGEEERDWMARLRGRERATS